MALGDISMAFNFSLWSPRPLDDRYVVTNIEEMQAIPVGRRYFGMKVYVVNIKANYQLIDTINGDLADNANWLQQDYVHWNLAYGWGNHSLVGYYIGTAATIRGLFSSSATGLTYSNTTGVFSFTAGYSIPTTVDQGNWSTAYGWGNHALGGYLKTKADIEGVLTGVISTHSHASSMVYPGAGIPLSTGSAWGTSIANNSTNWNTAYTHSQSNNQAHSDYLKNDANDSTTGTLTAAGLTATGYGILGRAAIGVASSTKLLDVVGNGAAEADIIHLSSGDAKFIINNRTSHPTGPYVEYEINSSNNVLNFIRLGHGTLSLSTTGITQNVITSTPTFTVASGATVFNTLNISPTINQTGTASGVTRGIYINPILTSAPFFVGLEINVPNTSKYAIYSPNTASSVFMGNMAIGQIGVTNPLSVYTGTSEANIALNCINGGNSRIVFSQNGALIGSLYSDDSYVMSMHSLGVVSLVSNNGAYHLNYDNGILTNGTWAIEEDGTHNLQTNGHSMLDHSATAWRMFYTNAFTGIIQELAFAAAGSILVSAGASAAPIWSPTIVPQALTQAGATLTMNVANGYNARVTLTANITTFTWSTAPTAGSRGTLTVIQDATGSRTMVMPSGHLKEGGTLVLSTAANSKDSLSWYYDGTNYFWSIQKAFA